MNVNDIIFDSDSHIYHYHGRQLHGITRAIGLKTNHVVNPDNSSITLQAACEYGSTIHKAVEQWIKTNEKSNLQASDWIINYFLSNGVDRLYLQSELLVSDFISTASAIDIVEHTPKGVILYDIKTGNFMRDYCTLQLNAYRYLYTLCYQKEVLAMRVLGTKRQRVYDILPIDDRQVKDLLDFNSTLE